ncbi:S1/P1 nuclease-domain-containing protein [Cladochytrium replicatum]|nr:S1/P1 nuclease-domain-containing protein [Cladochytrium replicatum]
MRGVQIAVLAMTALSCTSGVHAWGAVGHTIVANIAYSFLTSDSISKLTSLGVSTTTFSTTSTSSSIGVWADQVKSQSAYSWSKVLHYSDAGDNPPTSCSYSYSRDCADGKCVVGAIGNYTSRVCSSSVSNAQKAEAVKFLAHFFGDITQPLHICGKLTGGNDQSVTYDGSSTNLHSIWDTQMVESRMSDAYSNSLSTYVSSLVTAIKTGKYASVANGWASCTSSGTTCPEQWAADSDKLDCSVVWTSNVGSADLSGSYYNTAAPYIDQQLAKGGYRLGVWLNRILNSCTASPSATTTKTSTVTKTTTSTKTPAASTFPFAVGTSCSGSSRYCKSSVADGTGIPF